MSLKISNKILGFEREFSLFKSLFEKKKLPQTLMFQGLDGIGKYTLCLHLVSTFLNKNVYDFDELIKDENILILNSETHNQPYKVEDVKKIINFCQLKSFGEKSKFIILKNSNYLNVNSVNALLKLIEEPKENIYFFFTCNLLKQNLETLNSRFFVKKLFLNKKYYNKIIDNFVSVNNIDNLCQNYDLKDTPGVYLRKYFFNLNPNLESLKKSNEDLFFKIISGKILNSSINDLSLLKKLKLNLFLNNDIRKIINTLS